MWGDSNKFLQWHSSEGLFQLSFSSGVPVYPASIRWVAQWYPSVHWVNQWHSSGIPVYTGPASVHWLRVRECISVCLSVEVFAALTDPILVVLCLCIRLNRCPCKPPWIDNGPPPMHKELGNDRDDNRENRRLWTTLIVRSIDWQSIDNTSMILWTTSVSF